MKIERRKLDCIKEFTRGIEYSRLFEEFHMRDHKGEGEIRPLGRGQGLLKLDRVYVRYLWLNML